MMISCEKAANICTKAQYNEASTLEKLKLKLHILICKYCAKYSKKNGELTSLCDKAKISTLPNSEKEKMKELFKDKI